MSSTSADTPLAQQLLDPDLIRPIEAVAILAGRRVWEADTASYARHRDRLLAAIKNGHLTEYRTGKVRRFDRAEVVALKAKQEAEGIGPSASWGGSRRRRDARAKREAQNGLVNSREAAKITGVHLKTVQEWGRKGQFGAVKIEGEWFFDRELLQARKRARPRPPVRITCARCGEPLEPRPASSGPRYNKAYHPECWKLVWAETAAERAAAARAAWAEMDEAERSAIMSNAIRASWDKRDLEMYKNSARQRMETLLRSPEKRAAMVEKRTMSRYGHGLTEEQRDEQRQRARSRPHLERRKKRDELDQRIRELRQTELRNDEIAERLEISIKRVQQAIARLGLEKRQRGGRRPHG